MEEPTPQAKPQEPVNQPAAKLKKKFGAGAWVTTILAVLLVATLAFATWYWLTAEAEKKGLIDQKAQLQSQLDALVAAGGSSEEAAAGDAAPCTYTPSLSFTDNIKAALDSKNTAAFSTYTTNPVTVVLAASEFAEPVDPDAAALQMEYTHSATGPWDFNLPAGTIASYDAGFYTDYFGANTLVGKASSGMVVAFEFNCDGSKINKIFIAADDDLLL
jgi:hypothetical protein